MKKIKLLGMLALMLAALLLLSACAPAGQENPAAPAQTSEILPEPTQVPRPSAEELTALKNALEWTEQPDFSDFGAVTLDGRTVDQTIFASHKLTMVNIWATYCNPCISEMPSLAQLNKSYEDGEFQVIGLVVDMLDTDGSVHPLGVEAAWMIVDATGADYMHLLPTDDLIRGKIQYVYSVPETVFVDAQGNVLTPEVSYVGARSFDGWKAIVDGLLAQMEQE